MSVEPYVLRADGKVHESDVRYVTVFHNTALSEHPEQEQSYIASASRDLTARLIPFPFHGSDEFTQKEYEHEEEGTEGENHKNDEVGFGKVFLGHTAFVNFVLIHPNLRLDKLLPQHHHHQNNSNNNDDDDELHESAASSTLTHQHLSVITGSNDNHIAIWNAQTMSLEAVLDGHTSGVCCGVIVTETNHHHPKKQEQEIEEEEEEEEEGKNEESKKMKQREHKLSPFATAKNYDECAGNSSVLVTGDWSGVCHVFNLSHTDSTNNNKKNSVGQCAFGKIIQSYTQHSNAIRGVAHLPNTPWIVSASGDKSVHVWDIHTGQTCAMATHEHTDVIQCVSAIHSHYFATGSNDCCIKLWHITENKWNNTFHLEVLTTLRGHDSLIYGLAYNSLSQELISCSEDRTVLIWPVHTIVKAENNNNESEEQEQEELMTEEENNTHHHHHHHHYDDNNKAKITPIQCLLHPCVVWSVSVDCSINIYQNTNIYSKNIFSGDIVTAGADGVIRVWTRNDALMASVEKLEALEESITTQQINLKEINLGHHHHSNSNSDTQTSAQRDEEGVEKNKAAYSNSGSNKINVEQLPTTADLASPHFRRGAYEGEKLLVRNTHQTNDSDNAPVEVYIWSNNSWEKIGTVVAGPQHEVLTAKRAKENELHKEKHVYKGKMVDYLFNVEVQGTMLQLPYCRGESIFDCAQRFIDDHAGVVTQDSKEEIQNFLLAHVDEEDIALLTNPNANADTNTKASAHDTHTTTDTVAQATASATNQETAPQTVPQSILPWSEPLFIHSFQSTKAQHKLNEILSHPSLSVEEMHNAHQMQKNLHYSEEEEEVDRKKINTNIKGAKDVLIRLGNWPANNSDNNKSNSDSITGNGNHIESKKVLRNMIEELFTLWTHLSSLETGWLAIDGMRYALYQFFYYDVNNEGSGKSTERLFALHYVLNHFFHDSTQTDLFSPVLIAESSVACLVAYVRFVTNLLGLYISLVQPTIEQETTSIKEIHNTSSNILLNHSNTMFTHSKSIISEMNAHIEGVSKVLRWSSEVLQHTQRRQESPVKAAVAGLLHNISLYLFVQDELQSSHLTHVVDAEKNEKGSNNNNNNNNSTDNSAAYNDHDNVLCESNKAAALTSVKVIAQRLLFEPTGTPLTHNLLSTLLTLYKIPRTALMLSEVESYNTSNANVKTATQHHANTQTLVFDNESQHAHSSTSSLSCSPSSQVNVNKLENKPTWHDELVQSGKLLLQHTLQSLAIGADVQCHAAARALMHCLSEKEEQLTR